MDIFKLVGSVFVDTDAANDSLQKTGDKAEKTSSKFGQFAEKAGKVAAGVGTAAVAIGGAVSGIAKSSVDSYAQYQQSVGGIETLFKENADTVIENAKNAYKTAGMSATEYMDTVTGFSASLLQSLGGDTAAAAKAADTALVDMADNASKMGTDLSAIQSAYAGFSKGQYELLDNLKLGYGGTKTEMERLLSDAEKFSGVKYDINNLADVYDAIHVIQTEMDITGTTAKEASTTISGSTAMIQNKFEDLKTELGQAVAPVFQSVLSLVIDNMPFIQSLFESLIPVIVSMVEQFLPPLMEVANALLPVIFELLTSLLPVFTELLEGILPVILGLIESLAPIMVQIAQDVLPIIVNLMTALLPVLQPLIGLLTPILQLAMAFLEPLLSLINVIIPPLISLITNMASNVLNRIQNALSTGLQGFQNFRDKMKQIWEDIKDVVKRPINAVLGFINGLISGVVGGVNGIIRALNRFQVNVPGWVTKLTGITTFGFNLGELSAPQIPLLAKGGELEGGAAIVGEDGPELLQTNGQRTRVTPLNENNNAFTAVEDKLDTLIDLLQQTLKMGVFLDSGAMVGQLAPAMDGALGRLSVRSERRI